ncbi:MAG: F0F1-type ATP synthase membrane subunit b/b' [Myxococcota bacterium]|jgi:F0F1-type ATP synthase membrane subunit b/b'
MNRWIPQSLSALALLALSTGAMAAGGEVHHETLAEIWPKMAFHAFNLVLLLSIIGWFAGGKIKDALKNRSTGVRVELESAAQAKAEAKARFEALQARLDSLDVQISELHTEAEAAAELERAAIEARAERDATMLRENAERSIRDEVTRARAELRREAVGLAVELAGQQLRGQITADRQAGLTNQFLSSVDTSTSTGADNG